MTSLLETNPDFINTEGTKWWIDKDSTYYAQKENSKGISLDVQVWLLETSAGYRTYAIIEKQSASIIYTSQLLESIGIYIDILKANKEFSENE